MRRPTRFLLAPFTGLVVAAACGGSQPGGFGPTTGSPDGGTTHQGSGDGGTTSLMNNTGGDATTGSGEGGMTIVGDPTTCAQAATSKSYVGCDYWPTVTANLVDPTFDFTAVVANTQAVPANVTVTGPNGFNTTATVAANGLTKIYLPWVLALKGPSVADASATFANSVGVVGGAYHLVSSVPVTVYQFNALEYQGMGGPPGKDWSGCDTSLGSGGCFSYSNDASVLLPSTAMTGNYWITGEHGSSLLMSGTVVAITATTNNTTVTVKVAPTGIVTASAAGSSPAVAQTNANGTLTFSMNAGDVVELNGEANDQVDLSGSQVYATQPVQVITARQCANQPDPVAACDHLESSVLPAETLGKDYVVTVPTSPHGAVVGHKVRFFGSVNGTQLTYSPSQPAGCPSIINAGEVVECLSNPSCATGMSNTDGSSVTVACVPTSFQVTGTHEFAVTSFMLGGSAVDPNAASSESEGDPSMSPMVATEQYRLHYVFLAPTDYEESYADVVVPTGGTLTLDGAPVSAAATPLNASWGIVRIPLQPGTQDGAHSITGTLPFGLQVIGYGAYTSYQYPGGLDLKQIASAPPPPTSK